MTHKTHTPHPTAAALLLASLTLLAACTQDDMLTDWQNPLPDTTATDMPIGFDTYLSSQTSGATRADDNSYTGGIVKSKELQDYGFGIFASMNTEEYTNHPSNFMYNQGVTYTTTPTAHWTYSPLKYWPNMTKTTDGNTIDGTTGNDAQASTRQYVSFFAYAPYQSEWTDVRTDVVFNRAPVEGSGTGAPRIGYQVDYTLSKIFDLMWGVAPQGGIHYTAVNGENIEIAYGMPLVNMLKPDEHTPMKFLFLHALTAMNMTVALAVDQTDDKTSVHVKRITLDPQPTREAAGKVGFDHYGWLCLMNTVPNHPYWTAQNDGGEGPTAKKMVIEYCTNIQGKGTTTTVDEKEVITYDGAVHIKLNGTTDTKDYLELSTTEMEKTAFGSDGNKTLMIIPIYPDNWNSQDLPMKVTIEYDIVTEDDQYNTYNEDKSLNQGYVTISNTISKDITLKSFRAGRLYNLHLVLGLTSVKIEAEGQDWAVEEQTIDLPRNQD